MQTAEPNDANRARARRTLALGSLGLVVLGVFALLWDVLTETTHAAVWLPIVLGAAGLVAAGIWSGVEDAEHRAPDLRARDAVEGRASSRAIRWIVLGALLALLTQLAIPLRYYLGHDEYDERFSWRMFSAVRAQECGVLAAETVHGSTRLVNLQHTIHEAWITTLERNREAVAERYLRWRCTHEGVSAATLETRCLSVDGRPLPPRTRTIDCATEVIRGALE